LDGQKRNSRSLRFGQDDNHVKINKVTASRDDKGWSGASREIS
jgi:hypothetical protein